ncbi:MAG: NHL repeat-containing protein [Clostridia bacterium]|nr:NHL repeat-containing protein [Clostridia bacterium]
MKIKRILALAVTLLVMLGVLAPSASALGYIPYSTYTYSVNGEPQRSPHAYIPEQALSTVEGLDTGFSSPADVVIDGEDRLYIADTGNDRVVILNSDLTLFGVIKEFDNAGQADTLSGPKGVFVTEDGTIYVSDTENQRILWFSPELKLEGVIDRPESVLFEDDYEFLPGTLVVDRVGRLFVVSENMNKGILILDRDGNFKSFFGAQKVQYDPIEIFWRRFMTDEQIERTQSFVPAEYNSIAMDAEGFMLVTSSTVDAMQQYAATVSKSKEDQYAPVKRFGAAGVDVLYRNGEYPPSGDISVSET